MLNIPRTPLLRDPSSTTKRCFFQSLVKEILSISFRLMENSFNFWNPYGNGLGEAGEMGERRPDWPPEWGSQSSTPALPPDHWGPPAQYRTNSILLPSLPAAAALRWLPDFHRLWRDSSTSVNLMWNPSACRRKAWRDCLRWRLEQRCPVIELSAASNSTSQQAFLGRPLQVARNLSLVLPCSQYLWLEVTPRSA